MNSKIYCRFCSKSYIKEEEEHILMNDREHIHKWKTLPKAKYYEVNDVDCVKSKFHKTSTISVSGRPSYEHQFVKKLSVQSFHLPLPLKWSHVKISRKKINPLGLSLKTLCTKISHLESIEI